jgi:RNA polymerase sigma-70 factor (ECF subfamily)
MHPKSDELLAAELKKGSELAFTEIYNRYYVRLHIEANYRLQNKEEAADVVQDVFTAIWKNKAILPSPISLKSYLSSCVKNKCIDKVRKNAHFQQYTQQFAEIKELAVQHDPAQDKEITVKIHHAIAGLPKAQRKVFELFYWGLSHKEIVAQTGTSLQTIKNLLGTARKSLRKRLIIINEA